MRTYQSFDKRGAHPCGGLCALDEEEEVVEPHRDADIAAARATQTATETECLPWVFKREREGAESVGFKLDPPLTVQTAHY